MKVFDLFSGIGMFSLGLERAGFKTVGFCERDPFCQEVLKTHWPDVPIHPEIKSLDSSSLKGVEVLCGGFLCQDISSVRQGEGLQGRRSGLWFEYLRLIREVRPKYAIIENVAALRSRGLAIILKNLWEVGYNAQWSIIPARALGFPHQRDRIWIIAYPSGQGSQRPFLLEKLQKSIKNAPRPAPLWRSIKPGICRSDYGRASRLDKKIHKLRIKSLGNSLVPQIVTAIGEAIK